MYNFSCIRVYIIPDDGLQLEPQHVAVNGLIKLVICVADWMYMVVINYCVFIPRPEVFTARYDLCNFNYISLHPLHL